MLGLFDSKKNQIANALILKYLFLVSSNDFHYFMLPTKSKNCFRNELRKIYKRPQR